VVVRVRRGLNWNVGANVTDVFNEQLRMATPNTNVDYITLLVFQFGHALDCTERARESNHYILLG
jgi:hypothetical protein